MPPIIASVGELLVEFICDTKGGHHLAPARYLGPFPSGARSEEHTSELQSL